MGIKFSSQRVFSGPPTEYKDCEVGKREGMIVGVDRAASQMEDLQSADSIGRRRRALIRASSSTIHPLYSFSPKHHQTEQEEKEEQDEMRALIRASSSTIRPLYSFSPEHH